jgi:hypothetical protein
MMLFMLVLLHFAAVLSAPVSRNAYNYVQSLTNGDSLFKLGNNSYIANVVNPKARVAVDLSATTAPDSGVIPLTLISTDAAVITQDVLSGVVANYLAGDDVFTEDFLQAVMIIATAANTTLDSTATSYLASTGASIVLTSGMSSSTATFQGSTPPAGPYLATLKGNFLDLASVYLLYADSYRDFLYGAYDSDDGTGTYTSVPAFLTDYWDPMIPVPSRIYSWGDDRPLAGERVAVKDLYDMKGLITSGGSQAWAHITPPANETAPSIQKIVDLGGVLVGKYKLAQFASGADPWQWQDEQ